MEANANEEASSINALVLEYLNWTGLRDVADSFSSECAHRGFSIAEDVDGGGGGASSRPTSRPNFEEVAEEILTYFDSGHGAKFFKHWREIRGSQRQPSLEALTLEFYLHVYFATLPIRHGHSQDHPAAMKVFKQFLESCPATVGAVQELLPFYALPFVPDPTQHPTFTQVFQDEWVQDLRGRLCAWLGRQQSTQLPTIFSYLRRYRHHTNSVGATLLAQESAATAVRSQRTLRRKLQKLNEDYQKLIGVSWELTQALEAAVRGERVDLEATLAACTHRHPELFSMSLTADTSAEPATILLESMQRCERRPGAAAHLPALDFERVRSDLGTAPDTHVLLLLQALRHRITRVTTGTVRNAVVTSYVRGDVLGVRNGSRSWSRIASALTHSHHQLLAQTAARLINALTAFNAGRSYLACDEVSRVLLQTLKVEQPDPAATDMALAALQKLSIRDEVQSALIRDGCVEWLVDTLAKARALPPYTQEYAAALLMNLTLRSAGRDRCLPLAPSLLPSLTQLLAVVPSHVIPYVTGALYSLLSHPTLRQEAFDLGLDTTLKRLSQGGSQDQRRQLEYIIGEIQRDPPVTPPASPDPVLDMEEDPEWLEEELDIDDPVKSPPHAPTGEALLAWRYTIHAADDRALESDRSLDIRQPRSAPAVPWTPLPSITQPRPNTDGVVNTNLKQLRKDPATHWEYPHDSEEGKSNLSTERSTLGDSFGPTTMSTAWARRDEESNRQKADHTGDIWVRGEDQDVVRDWALSLRSGSRTPRLRPLRTPTAPVPDQEIVTDVRSDEDRIIATASKGAEPYHRDNDERQVISSYQPSPHSTDSRNQPRKLSEKRRQISLDDHDALTVPQNIIASGKNNSKTSYPVDSEHRAKYSHIDNSSAGPEAKHFSGDSSDRSGPGLEYSNENYSRSRHEEGYSTTEGSRAGTEAEHFVGDASVRREADPSVGDASVRREADPSVGDDSVHREADPSVDDSRPCPAAEYYSTEDMRCREQNFEKEVIVDTVPQNAPPPEEPKEPLKGFDSVEDTSSLSERDSQKQVPEDAAATTNPPPENAERTAEGGEDVRNPDNATTQELGEPNKPTESMYDVVASKLLEQIVGQSREVPSATNTPGNDPLLQHLPERKVSEYVVAFSSRPRLARTPPRSAAAGSAGSSDSRHRRPSIQRGDAPPSSPHRAVLPPISSNNHSYTKAIT